MKRLILFLLLVLSLAACAPDPRREAEAFAIRSAAEQEALNEEASRAQAEELHGLNVENLALEQAHREAVAQEWRNGLNMVLRYAFVVFTAAVCFAIFMGTRSVVKAFGTMTEGISSAMVRATEVRANLIRLDPATRQYPVFLQYLGHGRFSAVNFNTNSVLMLDSRNEPDRQMIAQMGAVQYAGALAQEARQSSDSAAVALISAPLVDVKEEALSVGRDMLRSGNE